jgi:hypothetical protein
MNSHVWAIMECDRTRTLRCNVHPHQQKFVIFCDDYNIVKWLVGAQPAPSSDETLLLRNSWSFENGQFVRRARFVMNEDHVIVATFDLGAFELADERARLIQLMHEASFEAASEKIVAFDRMLCQALSGAGHLPLWHRIISDRTVTYGDGGESDLHFPVLASGAALTLSSIKRTQLVDELHKLGEERGDYHEREPVLDIIDPALHALLLPIADADDTSVGALDAQRQLATLLDVRSLSAQRRWSIGRLERTLHSLSVTTPVWDAQALSTRVRQMWRWVPCEVDIGASGQVTFVSPIHQLPETARNSKLYSLLASTLQTMLPMFAQLGAVFCAMYGRGDGQC